MLSEIMMNDPTVQEQDVRLCQIFSIRIWPVGNRVPMSTSGLIDLIKHARSWRRRNPTQPRDAKPTVVLSHNGVSRCGIYVAANLVIDQMDTDAEVDIFHAVKMIRINRPQLIDNKEEYKYLYDLILHYYMSTPEYLEALKKAQANNSNAIANHL